MKTALKIFSLLMVIFIASGCKKAISEENISGTWEFRGSIGGMLPNANPKAAPGNGNILKFEGNNYQFITDGKVNRIGTYTIFKETKDINNSTANGYLMFDERNEKIYISLNKRKLVIFYGSIAADGVEVTYERL